MPHPNGRPGRGGDDEAVRFGRNPVAPVLPEYILGRRWRPRCCRFPRHSVWEEGRGGSQEQVGVGALRSGGQVEIKNSYQYLLGVGDRVCGQGWSYPHRLSHPASKSS